ncbi:MAG: MBOAT family protein [Leptospiraceae bacterium]|nr:MBOAT family protein [Leptospiraceae bacterium]MCP5497996.1 MBOAT family protein [Leptospiraceae bacterium]
MLFNSLHFLIFFPIVLIFTNLLKDRKQKIFLLLASFYFYMALNTFIVFLLLFSILVDYFAALKISELVSHDKKRKLYLVLSLVTNLGFLGYFKYTNFLLGVFNDVNVFSSLRFPVYNIILPVGISFYTFQSMSYTIDVYRGLIPVEKSFLNFALYISFFPQLVAGPIVRAGTFFRDLKNRLPVDVEVIRYSFAQILLGFTKKIVFADNLALTVDFVHRNHAALNAMEIWTGVFAFMWQIYFDFSGYTDIAIGVARLFGFQFDLNFYFPFNVASISQHWARWHISFTSWIRDYIYIPLGGSRGSRFQVHRNIFITFMFGGIWHGAAYHFLAWGIWHSIMLSVEREYAATKLRAFLNEKGGRVYDLFSRIFTMFCLGVGLPLFRADTMNDAHLMLKKMLLIDPNSISQSFINFNYFKLVVLFFITGYIFEKHNLKSVMGKPRAFTFFILANAIMIIAFSVSDAKNFIYFAF